MVKADPNDLETRLQLADALLANGQEQAAYNEVQRTLQIDPHSVDALMRQSAFLSARGAWAASEQTLRDALARHPEREDVRRQLAQTLLTHGTQYSSMGQYAAVAKALDEGQQLEPENYEFPLNLARVLFNQRKPKQARPMLERTLELAGDQLAPYVQVFQCWVIEGKIDEARAVLARAEAALTPTAELYGQLGTLIVARTTPPPASFNPFMLVPPKRPKPPADTPWTRFALDLLDKALALKPDDAQLRATIAAELLVPRPDLAQRYAEEAVRLVPDEPNMLITLGVTLAMNERKREAKEALRRAAQLARKQGNLELAQQADGMRREVDSPFFRAAIEMHVLTEGLDEEDLDELYF
jgi:Tfp pilus assembly protein PilF